MLPASLLAFYLYHSDQMLICTHAQVTDGREVAIVASVTIPNRTRTTTPRWQQARSTLAQWAAQGAGAVNAARHRHRSPALTATGLAIADAAFYQHGWFAGLLATGVSFLLFDWSLD